MPNFKWIFLFGFLLGQETVIHIPSINTKIVADSLKSRMETESNLSLEYRLKGFSRNPDNSTYLTFNQGKQVDTLIFAGVSDIRFSVLDQIVGPFKSEPIGEGFSRFGEKLVHRYYFFREEPIIEFGLVADGRLGARLHFSPEFESHFSGIFGMNKQNQKWDLNGEIDLHFENLIQTAEIFDLYWNRTDSLSQIIQFEILEPHPFGWDVGTQVRYHHEVVGGLYTMIETKSMLKLFVPRLNQLDLGYISGRTQPTEKGELNGYEKVEFKAFSLATTRDARNHRFVPSSGIKYTTALDVGLQEKSGFVQGAFEIQHYYPMTPKIHGMVKWMSRGIHGFRTTVPKSRYMIYGGAKTLRGFREQSFSAPQYQVGTFEAAYRSNNTFQTSIFLDVGADHLNLFENNHVGYGIGFTQLAERTLIKMQYALAKGQGIGEGKLHIKWVSRL